MNNVARRSSLEDIRKRALAKRKKTVYTALPNENSDRNAQIWNKELEEMWPSIYNTIK